MALKVCSVEVIGHISDIPLTSEETGAFCLVTYRGRPIGDLWFEASSFIPSELIKQRIAENFGKYILAEYFEDRLLGELRSSYPPRIRNQEGDLPMVSVVVCTRDRPEDLLRCLNSLSKQTYPRLEILVVDNASAGDDTRIIAESQGSRYVREDRKGLDFARNRGIRESSGSFIAFADDDVMVSPQWVDELVRGFSDESIVCVTGLTMPAELRTDAQVLFEKYGAGGFRKGYVSRVVDRFSIPPPAAGTMGAGANMAFRREIFDHIGLFDEALDCGTPALAGGDVDMFCRILSAGYRMRYQPTAIAWHKHRPSMNALERQMFGYGVAVYAFFTKRAVEYYDLDALRLAGRYFIRWLLPNAVGSILRRNPLPLSITGRELLGSLLGPYAYLRGKAYVSELRTGEGTERRCASRYAWVRNVIMFTRRFGGGRRADTSFSHCSCSHAQ